MLMEDDGGKDEKIIAVPVPKLTRRYDKVENYTDLPEITLKQIEHFFEHYKDLEPGKWVKIGGWQDVTVAKKLIVEAIERLTRRSNQRFQSGYEVLRFAFDPEDFFARRFARDETDRGFRNAKRLCQKLDQCLVGLSIFWNSGHPCFQEDIAIRRLLDAIHAVARCIRRQPHGQPT